MRVRACICVCVYVCLSVSVCAMCVSVCTRAMVGICPTEADLLSTADVPQKAGLNTRRMTNDLSCTCRLRMK